MRRTGGATRGWGDRAPGDFQICLPVEKAAICWPLFGPLLGQQFRAFPLSFAGVRVVLARSSAGVFAPQTAAKNKKMAAVLPPFDR